MAVTVKVKGRRRREKEAKAKVEPKLVIDKAKLREIAM